MDLIAILADSTLTRCSVFMTGLLMGYLLENQSNREWLRLSLTRPALRKIVAVVASLYLVHLIGFIRWPIQSLVGAHCYSCSKHLSSPLLALMLAFFYFNHNTNKIINLLSKNIFYLLNIFTPIVNIFHFLVMLAILDYSYVSGIRIDTINLPNFIYVAFIEVVFLLILYAFSIVIAFLFYFPLNSIEINFLKTKIKAKNN